MNQARLYFGQPLSFYERPYLTAKPEKDFIYDYDGPRGGRLTDVDQIREQLAAGTIQTSSERFLDYLKEVSGNHNKVLKWNLDSYRSVSALKTVGGTDNMGSWGPLRFHAEESKKNAGKKDKGFAEYIAATNMELNIADDREDIEEINKELSALRIQKANKDNFEDFSERFGFVRQKRALAGLSVDPIVNPYLYQGIDTRGLYNPASRRNVYSPDANE